MGGSDSMPSSTVAGGRATKDKAEDDKQDGAATNKAKEDKQQDAARAAELLEKDVALFSGYPHAAAQHAKVPTNIDESPVTETAESPESPAVAEIIAGGSDPGDKVVTRSRK